MSWALTAAAGFVGYASPLSADVYDAPASYYSTATATTSAALKAQLNAIIDGHIVRSYTGDAVPALKYLDQDPANTVNVLLVYSGYSVAKSQFPSGSANREHLWPNSYGIDDTNPAYSDLFNLRPCDMNVNSDRNNNYYDNGGSVGNPEAPLTHEVENVSWEPRPVEKGDIARSMFYMDTRYEGDATDGFANNLTLTDNVSLINSSSTYMGRLSTLLRWHYQDPVAQEERRRNHLIYTNDTGANGWNGTAYNQGNRNPFIDHPEYVWAVFGGSANDSKITIAGATTAADGASTFTKDYGRVIVGTPLAGFSVQVDKSGATPTTYDVTASGVATVAQAGTGRAFDYGAQTAALDVSLPANVTATPGEKTGTVTVNNTDLTTAGAGTGAADGNDTVAISATVVEHSRGSLSSQGSEQILSTSVDFGYVPRALGAVRLSHILVANLHGTSLYTAALDIDSVSHSGSDALALNIPAGTQVVGGSIAGFGVVLSLDAAGTFSATHTIAVSDEDIPGATGGPPLVVTSTARVISEATFPVSGKLDLLPQQTYDTGAFSIAAGVTLTKAGPGTLNVTGPQSNGAGSKLVLAGGPTRLGTDAGTDSNRPLAVEILAGGGATLAVATTQHLAALTLGAGATATVEAGGNKTLVTGTLSVAETARLDLADNNLIVDYPEGAASPLADVLAALQHAYAGGRWDLPGIGTSGSGMPSEAFGTTLGYADTASFAMVNLDGEPVDASAVVVKYTWVGDADLDGDVDAADLALVTPGGLDWTHGDFNYDGRVSSDDYALYALGAAVATHSIGVNVPEPAAAGAAACIAIAAAGRRRRR